MFQRVSAQQASDLLTQGEIDVVDVREASEWAKDGHLPGARLLPLAQLRGVTRSDFARGKVLFVCAAGTRSETAARLAQSFGLERVYTLTGGLRGWTKAGLPVVQERLSA